MQRQAAVVLVTAAVMLGRIAAASGAAPTPTPAPPVNPCTFLPCAGACALPAPCTPGEPCPQYVIEGTCAVVNDTCTCVTDSLTPPPTPTFGGCRLACDSSPCTGRCPDGTLAPGFCTALTVDQGCACAPQCGTPSPTPAPAACVGDCNADGQVTVNEVITAVNIVLGNAPVSACPAIQCTLPNVLVDITCIEQAVQGALSGCLSWYRGCGPPLVGFDPCPSTVTFCTTEQVGAPCAAAGANCCQPGSLCTTFGGSAVCNAPLVCASMRPRFCPI